MAKRNSKKRVGMRMSNGMKQKYGELFIAVLNDMEVHEWKQPWVAPHFGTPCNVYRKSKPYKGVNMFLLTMLCQVKHWEVPYFVTKNQLKNEEGIYKYKGVTPNATPVLDDNGCVVISDKGLPEMDYEKRFPVFFYRPIFKDKDGNVIAPEDFDRMTAEEQEECKRHFYMTNYYVYNLVGQTNFKDVYPDDYQAMIATPEHDYEEGERDDVLDRMIMCGEWRCPILFGGHNCNYSPKEDVIHLPNREDFYGDAVFYGNALHEMAHSTAKELNRTVSLDFGSPEYAKEEFVAELSSACICSMLGIGKLLNEDHVTYVQGWKKAIKDDTNFIPVVMDEVQRVVNYFTKRYNEVAEHKNRPLLLAA